MSEGDGIRGRVGQVEQVGVVADGSPDRNLPVAIIVGVVLAGAFLGSLFLDPLAFALVVLVISLVTAVEVATVLGRLDEPRPVGVPVLLAGIVAIEIGAYALGPRGQLLGVLVLVIGGFVGSLATHPRRDVLSRLGTTTLLGGWIGLFASYAILLANRPEDGIAAVLAVVGAAILGDIGGYVVGRGLGRTRIAPTVSPNKTWEGLLGGALLAGGAAWFALPLFGDGFADPVVGVVVAVLAVLAGFVGDLSESMVKRDLHVKDLGSILPAHGGMLDRVDGLLVALPVGYYAIELLA